jgi:hypothetical protein
MSKKGTIDYVERIKYGSYVKGTHFTKGDYIPTTESFVIHIVGGLIIEVGREVILSLFPGRQRINDNLLSKMEGMDASKISGK